MSLTADLCGALGALAAEPLPAPVEATARRLLLNVLATAVGAAPHPAVDAVVAVGARHGGRATAPVPGRFERLDPLWSATATGVAAHLDDFDDTHLDTVIHPGAAGLGAMLGLGASRGADGRTALTAFALGCEAQLRVGMAMTPWHYDAGWHITGTCGVLGAAVTGGLVAGLTGGDLVTAVGIAASQTLGIRDAFGTMTKPFHPGKAAANGLLAVLLAERGLTASQRVLEAPRGFLAVLSSDARPERVLDGLGTAWELERTVVKPYPCGIVSHPAVDAALALAPRVDPTQIAEVTVRCHALVPELTGNPRPADGLRARFSTPHGVAAGLVDGSAGRAQYADERVADPVVTAVRNRVRLVVDAGCPRDGVTLEVVMRDGRRERHTVEHARGSADRPLTDEELHAKVRGLVEPVLAGGTAGVIGAVEGLAAAPDLGRLAGAVTAARPEAAA